MPHPPGFWRRDGVLPRLLSPLAAITAAVTARRVARPGWRAPVPVICCGNVTVGGAGKTTVALDLGARLAGAGQGRALPAARLWRLGARAAPCRRRRHGRPGRRRGAAARRGRADLDRRRPGRQRARGGGGRRAGAGDGRRPAEPRPAQGPVAAGGRRRVRLRQRPRAAGRAVARAGARPGRRAARRRC